MIETKNKITSDNRHDSFIKKCLCDPIAMRELLEISFSEDMLQKMDFKTLKPEKTEFIDNELGHNHCDILLSIQYDKQKSYIYTLIEHQSTVDHSMVTRMLKYMWHIYDMHLAQHPKSKKIPLVCPLIIYAGRGKYSAAKSLWEMSEHPDRARQFFPIAPVKVIDLQKARDEEIDLDQRSHIGFLFYVMKSIFSKDLYSRIKKVQVIMKLLAKQNRGLKFLGNALCYTITTANDNDKKEKLIELFTNSVSQEYRGEFMTIADQFRKEGIEQRTEFIIRNMIKKNLDAKEISSMTGLCISEVEKFIERKKH